MVHTWVWNWSWLKLGLYQRKIDHRPRSRLRYWFWTAVDRGPTLDLINLHSSEKCVKNYFVFTYFEIRGHSQLSSSLCRQVWSVVLTQLPSDYNFLVKTATNHPSSPCWMHTWNNVDEKYSEWFYNLCASLRSKIWSNRFTDSATSL